MLRTCKVYGGASGTIGLNLSRAPWDPYPWVSGVESGSSAHAAGLRAGDTLLELNGANVLGERIAEIAKRMQQAWRGGATHITVLVWRQRQAARRRTSNAHEGSAKVDDGQQQQRHGSDESLDRTDDDDEGEEEVEADNAHDDDADEENWRRSINQQSLQKFATCLQHIAQLLECPVCLEAIRPPGWQCCNGHVLCNNCRGRSLKCPVCRVPLGPRGRCLLSDKLFTLLAESFPCESVSGSNNGGSQRKSSQEARSGGTADCHKRISPPSAGELVRPARSSIEGDVEATARANQAGRGESADVRQGEPARHGVQLSTAATATAAAPQSPSKSKEFKRKVKSFCCGALTGGHTGEGGQKTAKKLMTTTTAATTNESPKGGVTPAKREIQHNAKSCGNSEATTRPTATTMRATPVTTALQHELAQGCHTAAVQSEKQHSTVSQLSCCSTHTTSSSASAPSEPPAIIPFA